MNVQLNWGNGRRWFGAAAMVPVFLALVVGLGAKTQLVSAQGVDQSFNYTVTATGTESLITYPTINFDWQLVVTEKEVTQIIMTKTPTISGANVNVEDEIQAPPGDFAYSWTKTVKANNCADGGDLGSYMDSATNRLVILATTGSCAKGYYEAVYELTVLGTASPVRQWQYTYQGSEAIDATMGEVLFTKVLFPIPRVGSSNVLFKAFELTFSDPRIYGRYYAPSLVGLYAQTDYSETAALPWSAQESGSGTIGSADGDKYIATSPLAAPNGDTIWTVIDDNDEVDTWMIGPELHAKIPNRPPLAVDDSGWTASADFITLDVLANDSDAEGDTLILSGVTDGEHGTVAVNPDGTVTYTRNPGFNGSDSFTYTVSDGRCGTDSGTVTVHITPDLNLPVDVVLGENVEIAAGASLQSGVTIGNDATIKSGATIQTGAQVGEGATIGEDSLVGKGVIIGENVTVGAGSEVKAGADIGGGVTIGNDVVINQSVSVGEDGVLGAGIILMQGVDLGRGVILGAGVKLGKDVRIGDGVIIGDHTQIKDYSTVGTGATIGVMCQIGQHVSIGANLAIPDYAVIANGRILP